jgi:hypothetical protein
MRHGEWRSLVAHPAGGRAVAGSNPVSPIRSRSAHIRETPRKPPKTLGQSWPVFVAFRACSWHSGPQRDRSGRLAVPFCGFDSNCQPRDRHAEPARNLAEARPRRRCVAKLDEGDRVDRKVCTERERFARHPLCFAEPANRRREGRIGTGARHYSSLSSVSISARIGTRSPRHRYAASLTSVSRGASLSAASRRCWKSPIARCARAMARRCGHPAGSAFATTQRPIRLRSRWVVVPADCFGPRPAPWRGGPPAFGSTGDWAPDLPRQAAAAARVHRVDQDPLALAMASLRVG